MKGDKVVIRGSPSPPTRENPVRRGDSYCFSLRILLQRCHHVNKMQASIINDGSACSVLYFPECRKVSQHEKFIGYPTILEIIEITEVNEHQDG